MAANVRLVKAGSVFHALDGIVLYWNEIDTAKVFTAAKIMFQSPITTVSSGQQQALDEAAAKAITQGCPIGYNIANRCTPFKRQSADNRSYRFAISAHDPCNLEGQNMGKGNNIRGNKETRKPKAEKPKASATANSTAGKPDLTIARKKVK